ncbi:hypothetical protein, partial [Klebsiella pneumoniae]|uniref:hypothetical protein n=1 Tax=Klebsiella pneumoniae TaxID=573 RepID=UPI001C8F38DD
QALQHTAGRAEIREWHGRVWQGSEGASTIALPLQRKGIPGVYRISLHYVLLIVVVLSHLRILNNEHLV